MDQSRIKGMVRSMWFSTRVQNRSMLWFQVEGHSGVVVVLHSEVEAFKAVVKGISMDSSQEAKVSNTDHSSPGEVVEVFNWVQLVVAGILTKSTHSRGMADPTFMSTILFGTEGSNMVAGIVAGPI